MLKPGGRVYVSTPDSTFGEGSNPNHLRVWRAIEFADLLRRRGRIERMTVGTDTIAVASYVPVERRGEVAIFTGPSIMRWAPFDIETRGLGGSETAAVRLGEALAAKGYVVTVYGDCEPGCLADVIFKPWQAFDPAERRLAVVSSRMPELAERPINAQCKLLWGHDIDFGDRLTETFASRFDRILGLSDFHVRHLKGRYPFAADKIVATRNGINLDYFSGDPPKRDRRVAYTSSPDRGLDVLLEEWGRIRKRAKRAELCFAYAPVYHKAAQQDPRVAAFDAKIRSMSNLPGVQVLDPLPQQEVARLLRSSQVWVAPSWTSFYEAGKLIDGAPFQETFCIGACEAQAAGCHVVASGWGALPETVKVGALLNGGAPGKKWRDQLVDEIVRGLTDPEVQAHAQQAGPEAVKDLGWGGVADTFAALFEGEAPE